MKYINCIFIILSINFGTTLCGSQEPDSSDRIVITQDDCGDNEVVNQCGNLCQRTCDDGNRTRACPAICAQPACVCTSEYVRNTANGKCVLPKQCPIKCPLNEYLKPCGKMCEDTCKNYGHPKICPKIACTQFNLNCSCSKGFVRNPEGNCVLPEECPKVCGKNETYTDCGSSCPKTCNPRSDAEIVCPAVCIKGCFCKPGYVNSHDGCILPSDCPNSEKCFANETYTECGTACPDTCNNYRDKNRICTLQCVQGCACNSGLVLNDEGKCISPDECPPPKCGENEVYNKCGTACPDTCSNLGTLRKCIDVCVDGCFCTKGYVRSSSGKCLKPSQCPVNETCTKPHERYNSCGSTNQRSCDNFFDYTPCNECKEVCQCDPGYVRNSNELCAKPQECPNLCGENEVYDCGSACDTECGKIGEPCPIINIKCNEKCYCANGYARNSEDKCIPICECPKSEPEPEPQPCQPIEKHHRKLKRHLCKHHN